MPIKMANLSVAVNEYMLCFNVIGEARL